jgi:hypothetical protein
MITMIEVRGIRKEEGEQERTEENREKIEEGSK